MPDPIDDSSPFSPYRSDGKLYGFVCVVTGATQPLGEAIVRELAGILEYIPAFRELRARLGRWLISSRHSSWLSLYLRLHPNLQRRYFQSCGVSE